MQQTLTPAALTNPFPGLRTFESDEAHLFFGREAQTDELLRRLSAQRFLAVIGVSGSGKSSLVRAGLLPALHAGYLANGQTWLQVCFRPGDHPIQRLAESLAALPAFTPPDLDPQLRAQWVETSLRRSGRGLVEATRLARLSPGENLLIVVDQFEELFRYHPQEASAFVKLLLEAVHQTDLPIYVVITMRSDYLGNCAKFRDLPETLNDAQYLVPRMTRDQRRLAIEGPVLVGGGVISPALLNRLLNDAGEDPHRLPILQHALMRTWEHWASSVPPKPEIDLDDYVAIGEMAEALSRHADGAYNELGRLQPVAAVVFKRLTERDADHREVRRPATVGELQDVAAATPEDLETVLEAFLRQGRSFLTRSPGDGPLTRSVTIDISHESLIRSWTKLRRWAEEEAASGETYCRLADAAARHAKSKGAHLVKQDLDLALAWRETARPNAAWAERYGGRFAETNRFLDESRDISRREHSRRTWRRRALAGLVAVAIVFAVVFATTVDEVHNRRRALATQYLVDAYATAERGDFLRAAHLFGRAADTAVDDDVRRIAMLNVWQYAELIVTSAPATSGSGARGPVLASHALSSANGATLTWSANGQLNLWRETNGQFRPTTASHPGIVGAALSPDGGQAATWTADGHLRLWNTKSALSAGAEVRHEGITDAIFAGSLGLLTWGSDGTARVWSNPQSPRVLDHGRKITNAVIVSSDRWLVTWTDVIGESQLSPVGTAGKPDAAAGPQVAAEGPIATARQAKIWDLRTGEPKAPCGIDPMKVVVGSGRVLSINFDGTASFCDLESGRRAVLTASSQGSPIADAVFDPADPSSATLLTWSRDGNATLWRPQGGVPVEFRALAQPRPLVGAGFLRNGNILTWDADAVHLWSPGRDRAGAEKPTTFGRETSPIAGVQLAPRSNDPAVPETAVVWRADGSARLWDASNVRLVGDLPGSAPLESVEFSRTGHSVLMRHRAGRVRTFDVHSGSPELDRSMGDIAGATLMGDHAVLIWNADGATRLLIANAADTVALPAAGGLKNIVPDGKGKHVLAIDEGNRIAVIRTGEPAALLPFSTPYGGTPLGGATINAAGTTFLTWPGAGYDPFAFEDSTAAISATTPRPQVHPLSGSRRPIALAATDVAGGALSPDGTLVVTWGTGGADLWSAADGKPVKSGFHLTESPVEGAAFNKDNSLLLVWGQVFAENQPSQPFARLWRTGSLTDPVNLPVPGPVAGAVFDRDGRMFVIWTSAPAANGSAPGYACRVFQATGAAARDTCSGGMVVNAMFVSANQLLVSDLDGSARIWSWNDTTTDSVRLNQPGAVGGALSIRSPAPVVMTWSGETWRLWNTRDGTRASAVVRQSRTILAAQFDDEDSTLRIWDSGGTMRTWKVEADDDLPASSGNRLFAAFRRAGTDAGNAGRLLMALSGSYLDNDGGVTTLEPAKWSAVRQQMIGLVDEHIRGGECAHAGASGTMREHLRLAGSGE